MSRFFPNYAGYKITSKFGMRTHPVTGKPSTMHNGIDLVAKTSSGGSATDYITAHTGGTVSAVGYNSSAGYYVQIKVSGNTIMVYYHLKAMSTVKKGATVKKGDVLGYMGSSGAVTGAHLHWGIKKNGSWINPEPYLDKDYLGKDYTEGEKTVNISLTMLRKGAKGEQVKTLQRLLIAMGYDLGKYGADGDFGSATDKAVRAFQKDKKIGVDGIVGQNTWNKLLKG